MKEDQIRDRELNRHLDDRYGEETPVISSSVLDNLVAARQKTQRITNAINEVEDVQQCLSNGTLDYLAAAGILIEYLPEILEALKGSK